MPTEFAMLHISIQLYLNYVKTDHNMIVAPIKKFCFSLCFYLESIKLMTEIPISSVHGICRAIQFTKKFVRENGWEN